MHIRWGRVGAAAGIAVLGPPVLVGSALWATAPEPQPQERLFPGTLDCVTSEVLLGALPAHPDHGPEPTGDDQEEHAARALIAASRCRELGAVPSTETLQVFWMVKHGLAWMESHEAPDLASEHAVSVWELARDQQRTGGYLQVAVWQGLAELAESNLEPSAVHRARLQALASTELDWHEIRAQEEQEMWSLFFPMLSQPENALWIGRALLQLRLGTGELLQKIQHDEREELARAGALASSI
jgi:hypothetical protein